MTSPKTAIAICVNPMSGRDVRRLAARASNMTHEAKRDLVARIAAGADAVGVDEIFITREPFRIASMALEWMPLKANVRELDIPLRHEAADTERAVQAFLEHGVNTFVSLGGDGTNRIVARTTSDVDLIPISTGTNNVFPSLIEPTIAGMVAGLNAHGKLAAEGLKSRAKILHVRTSDGVRDIGLIDAVLLENDYTGNLLPFNESKIKQLLLTQASPSAIGMSPIGGFLDIVDAADDCGLLVEIGGDRPFLAPLSPGLFKPVSVKAHRRIPFDVDVIFKGRGVLALDGDREHRLSDDRSAVVSIRRDGPWVCDISASMRYAVAQGMMTAPSPISK